VEQKVTLVVQGCSVCQEQETFWNNAYWVI